MDVFVFTEKEGDCVKSYTFTDFEEAHFAVTEEVLNWDDYCDDIFSLWEDKEQHGQKVSIELLIEAFEKFPRKGYNKSWKLSKISFDENSGETMYEHIVV